MHVQSQSVPFLWYPHGRSYRYLREESTVDMIIVIAEIHVRLTIHIESHVELFTNISVRRHRDGDEKFDEIYGHAFDCDERERQAIVLPISPELSVSNVLKTCEQNLSALPVG